MFGGAIMKHTITIVDKIKDKNKTKTTVYEINLRNENLLYARLNNRAQTFTPKKGKGSFKRNKSYNWKED